MLVHRVHYIVAFSPPRPPLTVVLPHSTASSWCCGAQRWRGGAERLVPEELAVPPVVSRAHANALVDVLELPLMRMLRAGEALVRFRLMHACQVRPCNSFAPKERCSSATCPLLSSPFSIVTIMKLEVFTGVEQSLSATK